MVILSIPMVLGMAVYFQARNIIERNSQEIYEAAMEHASFEAEMLVQTATLALDNLIANRNVQKLSFITGIVTPDDVYTMYALMSELRNYRLMSPVIHDIFIVMNHIDMVLSTSGSVYQEIYFNHNYPDKELDTKTISAHMSKNHWLDALPVGDNFLFLKSTLDSNSSASSITAVVAVKQSRFIELFNRLSGKTAVYIFDSGGQDPSSRRIIASSLNAPELPSYFDPSSPGVSLKKDKRYYNPLVVTSVSPAWHYLCLIPLEAQMERVRQIQYTTLAGLLLCSFFSLFFAFRISKQEYKTQLVMQNDLEVLRNYCIYTLLDKPWDNNSSKEELNKYKIEFPGDKVMVLFFVISAEDTEHGKAQPEQSVNNLSLIRYNLVKLFQERVGRRFHVEMTDVGENIAAILNWSGICDFVLLENDIEEIIRELETQFQFSVVAAALGTEHSFPEGIYTSNLEARDTLLYLDVSSGQSIFYYRDIKNPAGNYQFPLEMEQKLITLIRAEEGDEACLLVRQIFEMNAHGLSMPMMRILATDIFGAIMKSQRLVSGSDGEPAYTLFLEQVPTRELSSSLESIIQETCTKNSSISEKKAQSRITEKIQAYIRENFRNPDLNISQTGYHFEMSPFYLSRLFKDETGTGLLEYINTLRVEEGKKLMAAGHNIIKTSEMVGFRGSNAFIRVFKKITGLTPGQYKEIE